MSRNRTAAAAWSRLTDRQQTYLRVLYGQDQALEEEKGSLAAKGQFTSTPARVWRRIDFNGAYSPVPHSLRSAGVYDSGAGATLAVLRHAGLIDTETDPIGGLVSVWLTRAGRAAARSHLGMPERMTRPRWALSEWLWRQMVAVAQTGEAGLPADQLAGTAHLFLDAGHKHRRENRPYLHCMSRMVPVVMRDGWTGRGPSWNSTRTEYRYHLTEEGRAHMDEHGDAYRELYPDVNLEGA